MSRKGGNDITLSAKTAAYVSFISGFAFGIGTFGVYHYLKTNSANQKKRRSSYVKTNIGSPTMGGFTMDSTDEEIDINKANDKLRYFTNENTRLNNLLSIARVSTYNYKESRTTLTPSDIETLRVIFRGIDEDQDGNITWDEFEDLHVKLGEPLTDKQAKYAFKILDPKKTEKISFDGFLTYWQQQHKGGKSSKHYSNRFQFISAKLHGNFNCKKIITKYVGNKFTPEFRVTFHYEQKNRELKKISPWHDIPLKTIGNKNDKIHIDTIYNFICEVPKYTRAKFEIATGEPFNPIKQDMKNGKLRFYQHGDMFFNYGLLPQTWENPATVSKETGYPGDNDPIDAIELGTKQLKTGQVVAVKCLGVLALLDDGETDWKILCININDPLAHLIDDVHDIDEHLPGSIDAIREFLRIYKVCTGSEENKYAFGGEALNKADAIKVIQETHDEWKKLKSANKLVV